MRQLSLTELHATALTIRKSIITMLVSAKSGHSAGALGMADVFTALYFSVLKHNPQYPEWPERDRVILSNGHICPVWYATLAQAGYFSTQELSSLRQLGSFLQGHPHRNISKGIENTAGPLGQGLSQAVGLAIAMKMDKKTNHIFCLMSDGEQQEGQNWEAYMLAGNRKLGNLTVLIDRNNIQIDGYVEEVMPIHPLKEKIEAFGWHVMEVDGHNIEAIIEACRHAHSIHHQPSALICHTTPGKGVEFMENMPEWHGKPPSEVDAITALRNLRSLCGEYWCE